MLSRFSIGHLIICSGVVATLLSGCGPHNEEASTPFITNGKIISKREMPEVVKLHKTLESGLKLGHCTGTFVSDRIILTAAHCAKGDVDEVGFVKNANVSYKGETPTRVFRNIRWTDGGDDRNKYDLVLLEFVNPLSKSFAQIRDIPAQSGDVITIVGFGVVNAKSHSGSGRKRIGENVLKNREDGVLSFEGVASGDTLDGANAASGDGDSGGPMYVDDELVGVTSNGVLKENTKISFYTDLQSEYSKKFFEDAKQQGFGIEP